MYYFYKLDNDPMGFQPYVLHRSPGDLLPDDNGDAHVVVWIRNHNKREGLRPIRSY